MRAYECVYILDPALEENTVKDKTERYSEIVTSRKGVIHNVDQWGKRRLAYPIKKLREGSYTLLKFSGNKEILDELNRVFRFDDAILRHMIVIDENPPPTETAEISEKVQEIEIQEGNVGKNKEKEKGKENHNL